MKRYTFEVKTLSGDWKPIFCRSLNSIDKETGCSVVSCESTRPFEAFGNDAAADSLAYFARFAGAERVRIANAERGEP